MREAEEADLCLHPLRPSTWTRDRVRRELTRTLWSLIGIFVCGFLFASFLYITYSYTAEPLTWRQSLSVGLAQWYTWTVLGVLIVKRLAHRFRFGQKRWLTHLAAYVAIGVSTALVKGALDWALLTFVFDAPVRGDLMRSLIPLTFSLNLLVFGVFAAVGQAYWTARDLRRRELNASRLEAQLAQAQLQSLKVQLHPHFLFNTLHTISMLNLEDPRAANRMIARLSDLLRLTLESVGVQEVPLNKEVDFVKQYLEIEAIRFQDRLSVRFDIDPASLDAHVPNLLLQPLVENAIRHGLADRESEGTLEVVSKRVNGTLRLRIRDNGAGMSPQALRSVRQGIGLGTTIKRLEQLYGSSHSLRLENRESGGLQVSIDIPFHEAPLASAQIPSESR